MRIIRTTTLLTLFTALSLNLSAGLYNNNNQSAAFLRSPSRSATYDIDGVYYNPAGTVFKGNGWYLGLNNESAWQTRSVTSDFLLLPNSASGNTTKYEAKIPSPIIPSIFGAYVTGKWAFSAYFMVTGGGGTAEYETGLPSFEAAIRSALYGRVSGYDYDSSFKGTMITYAAQIGASYRITDNLSAFAGVKGIMISNKYDGDVSASLSGSTFAAMKLLADQAGTGIAPVLGLNYDRDRLNIGVKYEFRNSIVTENETSDIVANVGGVDLIGTASDPVKDFADGAKWHKDMPALLTVGAAYDLTDKLKASVSWWHHFDTDATISQGTKYPDGKQGTLSGDTNEYQWSLEYTFSPKWLVSCGMQISRYGTNEEYWSDMEQVLDSETYGFGFRYSFTDRIKLDVGCYKSSFHNPYADTNNYSSLDAALSTALGTTIQSTDEYRRESIVVGLGLSFDF